MPATPPIDIDRLIAANVAARVEHFEEITSTQLRARECASDAECRLPLLVIADRQTAGRGRQGNRWWTGVGSLAFSLLFDPAMLAIPRRLEPRVALAAGVAIVDAVAARLPEHRVGLHWPNDIYVDRGKLAGVLVEVLPDGRHILGIGLNSNNSAASAPPELRRQIATLLDLSGRAHDRTQLLIDIMHCLTTRLQELWTNHPSLLDSFDSLCLQHDEILTLYLGERAVTGRCLGIGADGALMLDTAEGVRRFQAGTLRPPHSAAGG